MIPSPCLSPIRVYNKTLASWHYVPCGHCDACRNAKGFNLSQRLGNSISMYTHKYFFTLTHSDESLPVARYDSLTDSYLHPYDCDYNGVVYSVPSCVVEQSLNNADFRDSFVKYNGVPVLSRRFIINFKKRLRKIFAKFYGKEYLFLYVAGEYGPTTLRPHYHGVLCTNAQCSAGVLEECVHKAWSYFDKVAQKYVCEFGHIDFQRIVSQGVRNYVAQYLNCVTSLPLVYSKGDFRQFYQSSPLINSDTLRFANPNLENMFASCSPTARASSLQDNTFAYDILPLGLVNRYFPKCPQFGALVDFDRVQLYSVFKKQPFGSAKEFADNLISSFCNGNDALSLAQSVCVDNDYNASLVRLKRLYYVSRRVCMNAQRLNVPLSLYVDRIVLFWSRYELLKLKNFYELQESMLNDLVSPVELPKLFSLYFDTDDCLRNLDYYLKQFGVCSQQDINALPVQSNYASMMRKICLDTTKTKKRNGHFEKNGFKRPNYLLNNKKTISLCRKFFQI